MSGSRLFGPIGIIDIGSNSVRFVAYAGTERVPVNLFNEKIMAALGRGVARNGALEQQAMGRTLEALARYRLIAREIGLKSLTTVATAAVRDASNGGSFLDEVTALGLEPQLLPGIEEARLSALGVISAIPEAHGIVADLGGGSLELVPVSKGKAGKGVSLPLGVLRLGDRPSASELAEQVRAGMKGMRVPRGSSLYLVGGSFRALALLDLRQQEHPLPIIHGHRIEPRRVTRIRAVVRSSEPDELKRLAGVSSARVGSLPAGAAMLDALQRALNPKAIVASAFGLREGILYAGLDTEVRKEDPLLAAALEVGERLGRFGDHGAALDQWMAPLFTSDGAAQVRLRLAACLLADIAWNAHPDYRAERAVDLAVHGNWVGIDSEGRAILGRTLCTAFGGDGGFDPRLEALLSPEQRQSAVAWGKAIRLAQRLSGGTEALLHKTAIDLEDEAVVLHIRAKYRALCAEAVERRLKSLAETLGRKSRVEIA
ncbi:Ppx/GppA family phosphatase [Sphingomonas ginkgonis]|uniref:Ppx/GppA family phosphatase n=1 Tax=Sphingomonas ginkgonis TaxID=2315330 RepID=A0A3R9WT58_9SPHN|nr:Ppx/GppA family phosphatase [Sphingomonas ginkgonis]RST31201.1 Ppx/GppA family phosphatase [Sphingomonas ginkgonis]